MDQIWFNDDKPRRVKLRSAAVLVGKAPTKQKRIKAIWTMFLDGGGENQVAGVPEWLESDRNHVMKHGGKITNERRITDATMAMSDANLFKKTPTEAPKTQLDHFCVKQQGDADEPDTVVTFETRSPFASDLWKWYGQQSGEEFDVVFTIANMEPAFVNPDQPDLAMTSLGADAPDADEEDDASEDEDDESALADPDPSEKNRRKATSAKFDTPAPAPTSKQVADAKKKLAIM